MLDSNTSKSFDVAGNLVGYHRKAYEYAGKINTLGNANFGMSFFGIEKKELPVKTTDMNLVLGIPEVTINAYTYDALYLVIKAVETNPATGIQSEKIYTYF